MARGKITDKEKQIFKTRILMEIATHVGRAKAIGMGELYERVFKESYAHRINDTRILRRMITELRQEGIAICSAANRNGGGYWLASAGSEVNTYCKKLHTRALSILKMEANIRKISLPELMGQMELDLKSR